LSRGIFGGIGALILIAGGVTMTATYTGRTGGAGAAGPGASTTPSPTTDPLAGVPVDERCTDRIKANTRWVCLTSATFDGLNLTIRYQAGFAGAALDSKNGYHLHVYGSDGTAKAEQMGQQATNPGHWYVTTENPSVKRATSQAFVSVIGDLPKVCARIANADHGLVKDLDGGYTTGNCVPIVRTAATPTTAANPTRRTTRSSTGNATTSTHSTPTPSVTPTVTPTATSAPPSLRPSPPPLASASVASPPAKASPLPSP